MIFIVGVVGVPNNYGGFEALAENLVVRFSNHNVPATVFCDRGFPIPDKYLPGIRLERIGYSANGVQSIIFDLVGMIRAARRGGTILLLGTSASVFLPIIRLFWPKTKIIVNMAGLEWKRNKWGKLAQKYLKLGEYGAVKFSDTLVVDNQGLADYVESEYGETPIVIPYGGDQFLHVPVDPAVLKKYGLEASKYDFALARAQPDNNPEVILDAYAGSARKLVFVSNWHNSDFGKLVKAKFGGHPNLHLIGPIYDHTEIHTLRSCARLYVHGHSAGGTNPTLVEAMYANLPVFAFDVTFNRYTTEGVAQYFKDAAELKTMLNALEPKAIKDMAQRLKEIAERVYRWDTVYDGYLKILVPKYAAPSASDLENAAPLETRTQDQHLSN